jgi:hypothetical protein
MSTLAEALAPKSDQLNADDLIPGPRVLKVTAARITKEDRATKIVLNFEGDNGKPWKPCKTMGRAMVMAWAIAEPEQLVGKMVRVYRDPEVKFGDQGAVGGIRISHMSHIDKPVNMKLTVSQGKKALFTFHPLVTEAEPATFARSPNEESAKEQVALHQRTEAWADKYIAALNDAITDDELTGIRQRQSEKLAWVRDNFPAIYARVIAADGNSALPEPERQGEQMEGAE